MCWNYLVFWNRPSVQSIQLHVPNVFTSQINVRKASVLFWHPCITFNLVPSILSSLWRPHPSNQIPNPTFFQRGLNFPWPHQKSKWFHSHYVERDVLKNLSEREKFIEMWSLFLFIASQEHLVCTGAIKDVGLFSKSSITAISHWCNELF